MTPAEKAVIRAAKKVAAYYAGWPTRTNDGMIDLRIAVAKLEDKEAAAKRKEERRGK